MSVSQHMELLRLLTENPLLSEEEARRELGLSSTPPTYLSKRRQHHRLSNRQTARTPQTPGFGELEVASRNDIQA